MRREAGLIGSWDPAADGRDGSGHGVHAVARGEIEFGAPECPASGRPVARFRGAGRLEVVPPAGLGARDITVAAWVNAAADPTTVLGDVVSWFDPATRHGFTLGFEHDAPCGSHGNDRTASFRVDTGTAPRLADHGRPGGATVMVCLLASFESDLYAATWGGGPSPRGRVHHLRAGSWEDRGSPWDAGAVKRLSVHEGALHAGVSLHRGGGSGLEDPRSRTPAGGQGPVTITADPREPDGSEACPHSAHGPLGDGRLLEPLRADCPTIWHLTERRQGDGIRPGFSEQRGSAGEKPGEQRAQASSGHRRDG